MERAEKILLMVLGTLGLLAAGGAAVALQPPVLGQSLGALATAALFGLLAFGGTSLATSRGAARRLGLGPGRLPARAVAGLALGTLALSHSLESAIELADLGDRGALAAFDRALTGARGAYLALALACLGLASPLAEELFFRGMVQRGLERRLAGLRAGAALAVLAASALFGLAHLDPVHSTGAVFLGLYLGTVAWMDGSIRACLACHVANNLAAVLGAAFAWEPLAPSAAVVAGGLGVATAALLAGLRVRLRVVGRHHAAGQEMPAPQEQAQEGAPQQ